MIRYRLAVAIAISLTLGLTAFAFSYLGTSLSIPGPPHAATTEELRERGAETFVTFCLNLAEPRFWPECAGNARDERTRGAAALVEYCATHEPMRMFSASDCESADRPALALTAPPRPDNVLVGGLVAAMAFGVLAVLAAFRGDPPAQRRQG